MFTISDIRVKEKDSTGADIIGVYAKVENAYAIYRTPERVLVQFSDDPTLGADQRKLLAPLGPLRGEINGLIDGWRSAGLRRGEPEGKLRKWVSRIRLAPEHDKAAKAALFDRRVADALAIALQGGAAEAGAILTAVKADIVEERNSVARTEYVMVAGGIFIILIAVIALITGMFFNTDPPLVGEPPLPTEIGPNAVGFSAAMGALGALFSIALAIRSRELRTDLQSRDNVVDAAMRMLIGAVSAALLYCLIAANYFSFSFGQNAPVQLGAWQPGLAVLAFVAGFSERLVGSVLGGASLRAVPAAAANPIAGGAPARGAVNPAVVNERNPLGRVPEGGAGEAGGAAPADLSAANDEEEIAEGGHQHGDGTDEPFTPDVELPEAVGGVERSN